MSNTNRSRGLSAAIIFVVITAIAGSAFAVDKYRFIVNVANSNAGDPVIANIDFPRWILLDGVRNPVNQRSVKVYTMPAGVAVPSVMDSNLASLAYHYEKGVDVRFKAVAGVTQYAVEFETADKLNHALPPDFYQLGIGESLRYNYSQTTPVWGGWCGSSPIASDADNDGDFDLHLRAYDGGEFISRNMGTNQAPIFLPRTRYTEHDRRVQPLSSPYYIDWDNDGDLDRLTFTIYDDGYTAGAVKGNKKACFDIEFNTNGVYGSKKRIVDAQLLADTQIQALELERAVWMTVDIMDVDNDGRDDILVCGASNYIVAFLNKGVSGGLPCGQRILLPISGDDGSGFANNHQIEEMSVKFTVFDWDGDGKKDLLISGWNHSVYLLKNAGLANQVKFRSPVRFQQYGGAINNGDSGSPCMLDWDGDGDLDLMVSGAVGQIVYCENIGTRQNPVFASGHYMRDSEGKIITFNAESANGTIQGSEETYWGYLTFDYCDWDGDGDFDLIVNDSLGRLSWIENVGTKTAGVLSSEVKRFKEKTNISSNLYTHWALDGNFNDAAGGINLTSIGTGGAPVYNSQGRSGGCYVFSNQTSGETNCLSGVINIGANEPFTITAWINPTQLQDGFSDTSPHTVVKLLSTTESIALDMRIRDGKLDVYYTNPAINYATTAVIPINQWSFVSVTYYRNVIKIYVNGKVVYHKRTDGGQAYNRAYIGSSSNSIRGFNGRIDDVRIYKRELIDLEIAMLYGGGTEDRITTPWRNRPGVGDITGDGKPNILALDSSGRLVIYGKSADGGDLLERLGWISDSQNNPIVVCPFYNNQLGRTQVDLADWDGDGDLDIMYGQDWGMLGFDCSLQYMENIGTATNPVFTSAKLQAGGVNFVEWTGNNGKYNGHSAHPEMVDFNGNGTMDLLVGVESGRVTYYDRQYFTGGAFPQATIHQFQKLTFEGWKQLSAN